MSLLEEINCQNDKTFLIFSQLTHHVMIDEKERRQKKVIGLYRAANETLAGERWREKIVAETDKKKHQVDVDVIHIRDVYTINKSVFLENLKRFLNLLLFETFQGFPNKGFQVLRNPKTANFMSDKVLVPKLINRFRAD